MRFFRLFVTVLLCCLGVLSFAENWGIVVDDDFSRPNSPVVGAPTRSYPPRSAGWIDQSRGNFSIAGNRLANTNSVVDEYKNNWLVRPLSEATRDQLVVARTTTDSLVNHSYCVATRFNPTAGINQGGHENDGYFAEYNYNGAQFKLYKLVDGEATELGSVVASPRTVSGHVIDIVPMTTGASPSTLSALLIDRNVTGLGYMVLAHIGCTDLGDEPITDDTPEFQHSNLTTAIGFASEAEGVAYFQRVTTFRSIGSESVDSSPSTVLAESGREVVSLTGLNTEWKSTPPKWNIVSSLFGSTGAKITAQSVSGPTKSSATITAPSTDDTLWLVDSNTGLFVSVDVTKGTPSVIPVTDPHWKWSPYNWRFNGSTYAQSAGWGAYNKIQFNGTSLAYRIDTSANAGATSLSDILVTCIVDNKTLFRTNLGAVSDGFLDIESGMQPGQHCAVFTFHSVTNYQEDNWERPLQCVRITGVKLDHGSSLQNITLLPIYTKKALFFGDSITMGFSVGDGPVDGNGSWVLDVANALGAEFGQVGFGGTGILVPGNANVPSFPHTWAYYSNGMSRLSDGHFIGGDPDFILINHGTNDGLNYDLADATNTAFQDVYTSTLRQIRVAAPSSKIVVICPFGQYMPSNVTASFDAWKDPNSILINLGTALSEGMNNEARLAGGSVYSGDGIHPLFAREKVLAAGVLAHLFATRANRETQVFDQVGMTDHSAAIH